jgi:hypothetical protein
MAWKDKDKWGLGAVDLIQTDSGGHHWFITRRLLTKKRAAKGPTSPDVPYIAMDGQEVLVTDEIIVLDPKNVIGKSASKTRSV